MSLKGTLGSQRTPLKAINKTDPSYEVQSVLIGFPKRLAELDDVDLTELADGAMLMFDAQKQMFVLSPTVENNNTRIIGGKY